MISRGNSRQPAAEGFGGGAGLHAARSALHEFGPRLAGGRAGRGGINAEPGEFRVVARFLLLPHYRSPPSSRVGKSRVDHDPAYPSEPLRKEVRVC